LRRIDVKKITFIAAATVLAMTAATAGVAAELPTYEKAGLPISPVQVQLLGAADVQQQPTAANGATPHQLSVLTPRSQVKTATATSGRPETVGRSTR
jgi:hypothetical protein